MLPLYKRESDWMRIQPLEVPDGWIRVFPAKLLGGGRGSYWQTRSGGGRGGRVLVRKKISRFEIPRGWRLCDLIILQTNPVIKDYYFISNVSKSKCINSKHANIKGFLKSDGHFTQRKMKQMFSCLKILFQLSKCK